MTGVQGASSDLADLQRLFDIVRREEGFVDVLGASAGDGEESRSDTITEAGSDAAFALNAKATAGSPG